jgi:hypothetical protein
MAINMGIEELICYSESLLSINLILGHTPQYHIYAVLVQDIKDLMATRNYFVHHTIKEGNHSDDFMTKLGASADDLFVIHSSPPVDLLPLLRMDSMEILFPTL